MVPHGDKHTRRRADAPNLAIVSSSHKPPPPPTTKASRAAKQVPVRRRVRRPQTQEGFNDADNGDDVEAHVYLATLSSRIQYMAHDQITTLQSGHFDEMMANIGMHGAWPDDKDDDDDDDDDDDGGGGGGGYDGDKDELKVQGLQLPRIKSGHLNVDVNDGGGDDEKAEHQQTSHATAAAGDGDGALVVKMSQRGHSGAHTGGFQPVLTQRRMRALDRRVLHGYLTAMAAKFLSVLRACLFVCVFACVFMLLVSARISHTHIHTYTHTLATGRAPFLAPRNSRASSRAPPPPTARHWTKSDSAASHCWKRGSPKRCWRGYTWACTCTR
jgi:hypothetical protein